MYFKKKLLCNKIIYIQHFKRERIDLYKIDNNIRKNIKVIYHQ